MTFHFVTGALAALAATTMLAAPAGAETLRLNHNLPDNSVTGKVFDAFAARVEELTDGALKIRVFHAGQLGGQRESIELVQQGALDIAKTNAAEMEAFIPLYAALNLPFIFTSPEHVMRVLQGEAGDKILAAGAETGLVGLGPLYEGCRSFYTTEPASALADLAGRKIRV